MVKQGLHFVENNIYKSFVVVVTRKSLLVRSANVRVTRRYVTLWLSVRMTFSVAEISSMQV